MTKIKILIGALLLGVGQSVMALPALQLGPGTGTWMYDTSDDTWDTTQSVGETINLKAYANAITGNGASPFDTGNTMQTAYLVVSAVPKLGSDVFDVTVTNNGNTLSIFDSGFGSPPVAGGTNNNSDLPSHGIFDTWFEVYLFEFDEAVMTIGNTQPGGDPTDPLNDPGDGFIEMFNITLNSIVGTDLTGIHFDLFTTVGEGIYDPDTGSADAPNVIFKNAPFSHDAESTVVPPGGTPPPPPGGTPPPPPTQTIPEPSMLGLLGLGLLGAGFLRGRRKLA